MTNLYITNDLFFHNWNSADNGKLWFGIQAYIDNHEGGHLQNWVTSGAIFDGKNTQFRLMNPSTFSALNQPKLVPVPIPSDLPITVILKSSESVVWQKTLERKEHCKVANPDRLRELNGFGKPPRRVKDAQKALTGKPYPHFFAATIKNSMKSKPDEEHDSLLLDEHLLSTNLVEKLELGQRQHYDGTVFTGLGEPFDATDPFTPASTATNTHYLLGQLIEIEAEITTLKTVTHIELRIGDSHLADAGDIATEGIFSTIKDNFDPTGFDQSLVWDSSYASRINALPMGETFRAHRLASKNQYLWRLGRRSDAQANSSAPGNAVDWNQLQRFDIRENAEAKSPIIEQHESLVFRPVITFDVKIVRYRNTPPRLEKAPLDAMLVAIRPTASDKQRFDALLKNAPGEFNKAKLFVINGEVREKGGDEGDGTKPKRVKADYEITPDSLKVYDFPWQSDLELIAFFNTGADQAVDQVPDNAEYVFDDFIYQDAVLCINQGESDTITMDRKGFEAEDMFGPRWEYWHEGKHDSNVGAFNGLLCDVLNDATIDADQLIISAFHNDRKDYELSQSARRLEGIATSSFKGIIETDPMDPSTFSFEQVLIEDKTNHNQMNISERRQDFSLSEAGPAQTERVDLRNVNSAIPAFQYDQKELGDLKSNLDYAYRVVMTDKTSAISNEAEESAKAQLVKQNGSDAPSIRDFYYDVYQNIGNSRHLELNLEHTYGSTILLTSISGIPNPIDEPILLITDVGYSEYDTETKTSETQRFVTCELSNNGERSEVTLHFSLDFLNEDWAKEHHKPDEQNALNAARQLTHIQAWQSAAELYFTRNVDSTDSKMDGEIRLFAECYVFDVNSIDAEHSAEALRNGLVKHEIAIPAANNLLYAWSKKVFIQALDPDQDGSMTIPLDQSIGEQYHCVRFRLELERSARKIPSHESEWKVYERFLKLPNKPSEQDIDELFTMEGPKSDLLDFEARPAIAKQVEQFLLNLKLKGGYLYPKKNEDTAAGHKDDNEPQSGKSDKTQLEGIFALLGDGAPAAHTEPCNNAWIIPEKTITTNDTINVAYCPIGITPITNSPLLPNKASQTIRKYFEAFQAIIDLEPLDWYVKEVEGSEEVDAETLRNTIDALVTQIKDNRYLKLIEAAQSKFLSVPDPEAPDSALNERVKTLSGQSRNKAHAIGKQLSAQIRQLLIEQPVLFSSLKALGALRVTGSEGPLSTAFYDIHLSRKIDEKAPLKDTLVDFRLLLQKDGEGLTYLEHLDDATFDNEFILEALHGETVERVLEQVKPGTNNSDYHILLSDNPADPDGSRLIHVPEPDPIDVQGAMMRLPSRRPVADPVMSAARQLDRKKIDTEFPVEGNFQLDPFLQGLRITPEEQPPEEQKPESLVRFHSKLGVLSIDDLDHVGVLTLFRITGDEEAPKQNDEGEGSISENSPSMQEISDQFENDAFYVLVTDEPLSAPRETGEQRGDQETTAFEALLKMLDSQTPYALQEGLFETVLDQNNLSTITNIISADPRARSTPNKHVALAFTIEVDETTGTDLKLVNLPRDTGGWDNKIRAQLYGNEKGDTFVWIETDMSVWKGKYVSMIQTRNQAISTDLQQAVFAPEFVTISNTIGGVAERTTQLHSQRADQTRPNIANNPMTIRTFVEAVLGDEITFDGDDFGGAINRLNITIKQDASTFYPSNFEEVEVFNGTFAQQSLSVAPLAPESENKELDWSSSDLILWFPELESDSRWRIDFEWRSPMNNDEILRIEDVPITVQQVADGP